MKKFGTCRRLRFEVHMFRKIHRSIVPRNMTLSDGLILCLGRIQIHGKCAQCDMIKKSALVQFRLSCWNLFSTEIRRFPRPFFLGVCILRNIIKKSALVQFRWKVLERVVDLDSTYVLKDSPKHRATTHYACRGPFSPRPVLGCI